MQWVHKKYNRFNRNRSLLVSEFEPETREEEMILEMARGVGDTEVRYLKYVLDQHDIYVIRDAWEELREATESGRDIRSPKRFLTYLIEQRIRGDPKNRV